MIKYGLKLWSNNKENIILEAKTLLDNGQVDFLELYIHPEGNWEAFKILKNYLVTIHATHYDHGFDLMELDGKMLDLYNNKVLPVANFFNSPFIVLHPGCEGDTEDFSKNLEKIQDKRLLLENMPKTSLDEKILFGHKLDELKWVKENERMEFCLDFSHAIASANSQGIPYKKLIGEFLNELNPSYFHIGGANSNSLKDEHLNLWDGSFNLNWIKLKLVEVSENRNVYLVFEIPKIGDNLRNDLKNVEYFKKLKYDKINSI